MLRKTLNSSLIILTFLVSGLLSTSCSSTNNPTTVEESTPTQTSAPPSPKTGFEADLDYVRKGQYTYIWVFSRKDGKPLDKEDGAFLKKNAPQVVDWVRSEGSNKVVAGTNFDLAKGNLELLKKRFIAEDYSGK